MVNRCEPLINVVTENKPKVLTGPRRADEAWAKRQGDRYGCS